MSENLHIPEHLAHVAPYCTARLKKDWRKSARRRLSVLRKLSQDPVAQGLFLDKCRRDPVFFINHFAWLLEPRNATKGIPPLLPFDLYPRQEELVRWLQNRERTSSNGAVPKSRGVGATWVCVAYTIWCWLFRPFFKVTWSTLTKLDLDARGNPDSVFEKLRVMLRKLPAWFRALVFPSFDEDEHDNDRRLINPDNGSVVTGEVGNNMGRSGRSAIYFWDEAAHADNAQERERAVQETTDCLIEVSTPNGMDNPFATKVLGASVATFFMRWDDVPWRPPEWLEWRKLTKYAHDELGFKQELLIDFLGSADWVAIPPAWVQAAIDYPAFAGLLTSAGFDVARTKDRSVLTIRRGPVVEPQTSWGAMPSHESAAKSSEISTREGASQLSYDAIGVGEGVASWFGQARAEGHAPPFEVVPVVSSQRATNAIWSGGREAHELFGNLRAELWWTVRERFRKTYANVYEGAKYSDDECISIPNDPQLVAEISWVQYRHARNGKIYIESKDEMKKRRKSSKSPDKADSLVYSYADDILHPEEEWVPNTSWV